MVTIIPVSMARTDIQDVGVYSPQRHGDTEKDYINSIYATERLQPRITVWMCETAFAAKAAPTITIKKSSVPLW
jgi:hypothetical protein